MLFISWGEAVLRSTPHIPQNVHNGPQSFPSRPRILTHKGGVVLHREWEVLSPSEVVSAHIQVRLSNSMYNVTVRCNGLLKSPLFSTFHKIFIFYHPEILLDSCIWFKNIPQIKVGVSILIFFEVVLTSNFSKVHFVVNDLGSPQPPGSL